MSAPENFCLFRTPREFELGVDNKLTENQAKGPICDLKMFEDGDGCCQYPNLTDETCPIAIKGFEEINIQRGPNVTQNQEELTFKFIADSM